MVNGTLVQQTNLSRNTEASPHSGAPTTSAILAPGMRIIRVVDRGGMVPDPGSVVDVLATIEPSAAGAADAPQVDSPAQSSVATIVVAQGAVVVTDTTQSSQNTQSPRSNSVRNAGRTRSSTDETGIMLLVRDEEARAIASASVFGVVTIVLAPSEEACCTSRNNS